MTQASLRQSVFWMWCAAFVASVLILLAGPALRPDGAISSDQGLRALPRTSVYLPALTAFAAFWFPETERRLASTRRVAAERVSTAIGITAVFLVLFVLLFAWPVLIARYDNPLGELPYGQSFEGRLDSILGFVGLMSAIGMAPAVWLTRVPAPERTPPERRSPEGSAAPEP